MTWWDQFTAQFVGDLLAAIIVLPLALWAEAKLDERRERRHGR